MSRPVAAGIDGSAASLAAAAWAAREAELRDTALHLVAAWPPPDGTSRETPDAAEHRHFAARSLDLARDLLRRRHPRLDIHARLLGLPHREALLVAGLTADLLVLGSSDEAEAGMSTHLPDATEAQAATLSDFPVAIVRPLPHLTELPDGPVLLALDADRHVQEDAIALAFAEAAMRDVPLRALYVWLPPGPVRAYPVTTPWHHERSPRARHAELRLTEALLPWRRKFPDVRVEEMCLEDVPAGAVTVAAQHASLAVLGHRVRSDSEPLLGAVALAAVQHAPCPVLLVPHA